MNKLFKKSPRKQSMQKSKILTVLGACENFQFSRLKIFDFQTCENQRFSRLRNRVPQTPKIHSFRKSKIFDAPKNLRFFEGIFERIEKVKIFKLMPFNGYLIITAGNADFNLIFNGK